MKKQAAKKNNVRLFMDDIRFWIKNPSEFIFDMQCAFHNALNKPHEIRMIIKHAWQRARYGIDDSMTWDMDGYLTEHIVKLLKQYLKHASGAIVIEEGYRKHINELIDTFESYNKLEDYNDSEVLGKSFEEYAKLKNEKYNKALKSMRKLFTKNFSRLWW